MILGIGIDMVAIGRFSKWLEDPRLMSRYFSQEEINYVQAKGLGASASLAARFAAKEAFGKALGCGLKGISLKDIRVVIGGSGKPELDISGTAEKAFLNSGGIKTHLSLTHDGNLALAQVIIEGEDHV